MIIFKPFSAILLCLMLLVACAGGPPLPPLNSERIEARFGSYGVQILEQGRSRRVTCLYSMDGDQRRCRTLAIVRFADPAPEPLRAPLDRIRAGASLGATLSAAGWQVDKVNRYLGETAAGSRSTTSAAAYFAGSSTGALAVHIYDLRARSGSSRLQVAQLLEIHDPAYLRSPDLEAFYNDLPGIPMDKRELAAWFDELETIPPPAASRFN